MTNYNTDPTPGSGSFLGREPALWIAAVGTIVALAVGFGANISAEQFGLIMAAVAALLGVVTRSQVSPKQ